MNISLNNVEITLDSFIRAHGRKPTEAEASALMRLKAKQEKRFGGKETYSKFDRGRISQEKAISANKRKQKELDYIVVNKQTITINRLLVMNLNNIQIAYALHLSLPTVERVVDKYDLPRDKLILK
tara:strand:- start:384 stop:761 length:378 start_codon:yes stop_codon:yes gene_type:complete